MKRILLLLLLFITYGTFGCSMPATSVRTVDDRPTLIFKGAPDGAVLFVDGLNLGPANQYNGAPKALIVEPGTHNVRITVNDVVVYEQRVFVESSLKTITVR